MTPQNTPLKTEQILNLVFDQSFHQILDFGKTLVKQRFLSLFIPCFLRKKATFHFLSLQNIFQIDRSHQKCQFNRLSPIYFLSTNKEVKLIKNSFKIFLTLKRQIFDSF